jgi:exodeoxyribonuclease-1
MESSLAHRDMLAAAEGLAEKLRRVFQRAADLPPPQDPELAIYGGFLPDADKRLLSEVRATPAAQLAERTFPFRDQRYPELLFRYRARNWPETLSAEEQARWGEFRRERLLKHTPLTNLTLDEYFARIAELRAEPANQHKLPLLDQLQLWGEQLAAEIAPLSA